MSVIITRFDSGDTVFYLDTNKDIKEGIVSVLNITSQNELCLSGTLDFIFSAFKKEPDNSIEKALKRNTRIEYILQGVPGWFTETALYASMDEVLDNYKTIKK
jgi:hypothetical protein